MEAWVSLEHSKYNSAEVGLLEKETKWGGREQVHVSSSSGISDD